MTPKQKQLLDFIIKFKSENGGDSPSIKEMGQALGVTQGTVQDHLKGLIKAGKLKHDKGLARRYRVMA